MLLFYISIIFTCYHVLLVSADYNFQLLHINDIHSTFEEINKNGEKCKQVKGRLFSGNFSIFDLKEISTVTNFLARSRILHFN